MNSGYSHAGSLDDWMQTWFIEKPGNESVLHYASTNAIRYLADAISVKTEPETTETKRTGIRPPDPEYNDKSLSEWLKVLYRYEFPRTRITNWEAKEAVQNIGTNALPLLLNWIATPEGGGWSYPDYAVGGFEVLGPVAKPAVPDLIKLIGQNQDYPDRVLLFIGKDAVPQLADKMIETFSDTNDPYYFTGIRVAVRTTSGFYIRERILGILNQLGTNAEAALPALIQTVTTNQPTDYRWWSQQNPYAVFVNVGRNHEDKVIPMLLERFNNPNLPQFKRGQVADAMSIFGTNQAKIFLPVLIAALSENKTNDGSRVQICGALAAMGGNQPDLLVPVFLAALKDKNNGEGIRCSIAGNLAAVGHNQADIAVPALMTAYTNCSVIGRSSIAGLLAGFGEKARSIVSLIMADSRRQDVSSPNVEWKVNLVVAAKTIAPDEPDALVPLIADLENHQIGIQQRMIWVFGKLGTNGVDAVPALLTFLTNNTTQIRADAIQALNAIGVKSDEYIAILGQLLSDPNSAVSGDAASTLSALATHSKLAFTTLLGKAICGPVEKDVRQQTKFRLIDKSRENPQFLLEALDDPDPLVRSGDLYVFYQMESFVPDSIPKLRQLAASDPDSNIRSQAADVLKLQLQQ